MRNRMIQAPSANLVTATTTRTRVVATAPTRLNSALVSHPSPPSRRHFRTMPAWESVNETNTPIMYSGMRAWVSPLKATSRMPASRLRTRMPFEKARRSPWFMNCRGR